MTSSFLNEVNGLDSFNYNFPSIRGIQAGREYYISMCPVKLIPKIFLYNEIAIPAELRAQRTLNNARIPEIANYLINNPKDYVFSAISASVCGEEVKFIPAGEKGMESKMGALVIPMTAQFLINDGQHRRAAIEAALKQRPELGNETISVVFFIDAGLKRSQQIFSDLNRHAVRPTKSISILYDYRDQFARFILEMANTLPIFKGFTDLEKTSISNRSTKMFTLSSIYQATEALLGKKSKIKKITASERQSANDYWTEVTKNIPEWKRLANHDDILCNELRGSYIHSHGIALHALGIAGRSLFEIYPDDWQAKLSRLEEIDWSRSNSNLWEGRAMNNGRISKAYTNLILTSNLLKEKMGIPLIGEEQTMENLFLKLKIG
ncbi:MAG: DNA sulfur modification protein DndB [Methanoregula sp.]|nr:DNA sulfur modification protein DndB [Methanoregula sp.]